MPEPHRADVRDDAEPRVRERAGRALDPVDPARRRAEDPARQPEREQDRRRRRRSAGAGPCASRRAARRAGRRARRARRTGRRSRPHRRQPPPGGRARAALAPATCASARRRRPGSPRARRARSGRRSTTSSGTRHGIVTLRADRAAPHAIVRPMPAVTPCRDDRRRDAARAGELLAIVAPPACSPAASRSAAPRSCSAPAAWRRCPGCAGRAARAAGCRAHRARALPGGRRARSPAPGRRWPTTARRGRSSAR